MIPRMDHKDFVTEDRLFYEDDVFLPDVEVLIRPSDTKQERTDRLVEAVLEYLRKKDQLRHIQISKQEAYRKALVE